MLHVCIVYGILSKSWWGGICAHETMHPLAYSFGETTPIYVLMKGGKRRQASVPRLWKKWPVCGEFSLFLSFTLSYPSRHWIPYRRRQNTPIYVLNKLQKRRQESVGRMCRNKMFCGTFRSFDGMQTYLLIQALSLEQEYSNSWVFQSFGRIEVWHIQ